MKKLITLFIVTCFVCMLPLIAQNEDKKEESKKENWLKIELGFGVKATGKDGQTVKAKEYDPIDNGLRPVLDFNLIGIFDKTYLSIFSEFQGHMENQRHLLDLDVNRVLKQTISFDALYHRLDHDPLSNIDVVSEARSGAYTQDFNPNQQYHIRRNELISQTRLSIPSLPFMKLYVNYRDETRKGEYQARTLSKCSACHVVAKSRSINSYNRDIQIGSVFDIGKSMVDYSYTSNQFRENEAAPTNNYLLVTHPEKIIPVFDSRIAVGNNVSLPFDEIPGSKKGTHLLQTVIPVSEKVTVSGQYVNSSVKNTTSNIKWNSNSIAGSFSTRIGKKGSFNTRLKHLKVTNDSIFVDINEPVDVGGPNVGKTYAEAYGWGTFDFTRLSALSRSTIDLDATFRYRLSKQLRVQLGFEYDRIDREHYDVESTSGIAVNGKLTYRPVNSLKLTLEGVLKDIKTPFANMKGAIAPLLQREAYPNPFVPMQFYEWHQMRTADITNYPSKVNQIKGRFNWSPSSRFALNGNVLIRSEENNDLNFAGIHWSRDFTQFGVDMWLSPFDKLPITATYYNSKNTYGSVFAMAVIEGCGAGLIGGMTGTLTDMMDYDVTNQTLLLNASYLASDKLTLYCNFNYNTSVAAIKNLSLDSSQVEFIPGNQKTALNYDNYGEISDYSKLNIKQNIGECGFELGLSDRFALTGAVFYYFYDDLAEYLFTDTTGKSYSGYLGFTWRK